MAFTIHKATTMDWNLNNNSMVFLGVGSSRAATAMSTRSSQSGAPGEHSITIPDSLVQHQLAILAQIERDNQQKKQVESTAGCFYPTLPRDISDDEVNSWFDVDPEIAHGQSRRHDDFENLQKHKSSLPFNMYPLELLHRSSSVIDLLQETILAEQRSKTRISALKCSPELYESSGDSLLGSADHIARLDSQNVMMRGTDHTYQAIQAGTATTIRCLACDAALQVPAHCKAVYCTCCHHISPVSN
jgi:hypothetical protein